MGCNSCKNKEAGDSLKVFINGAGEREAAPKDIGFMIFNVIVRLIIFGITVGLSPLILIFVVYLLFKTIMLNNGSVDLMPSLLKVASSIGIGKKKVEEEHPEDYEDLDPDNPEDYELDEKVDKVKL